MELNIATSPDQLGLRSFFLGSKPLHWKQNVGFSQVDNDSSCRARFNSLKFRNRSKPVVLAADSIVIGDSFGELSSSEKSIGSINPVYLSTPPNRESRTPHSGFHFDGSKRKFFEGWYFKVSIPERRQSFCFMYSVESPAFRKKLSTVEQALYGPRFTGVGAQILGADDKYICQYSEESQNFWGSRHELQLGNTFTTEKNSTPPNKEVPPQVFDFLLI
ncbi:hypothetical protein GIB67_006622 [Kingdonia uniflora]|uniref:Uncharacterized protein n=1 Tax=Kingdonia uniflora TaxID=39325 RepID=A0A7J7LED8_9MAGN|nr:hypothetical protein GIB67_006622 [Kingdonia uniflora]